MWRALFLAVGITMCIVGGEFLMIDKAVLAKPIIEDKNAVQQMGRAVGPREIVPKEWMPWGLITGGAVIVLYSLSLRRE